MASDGSTTGALTEVLLDLLSSSKSHEYYQCLRDEAESVFARDPDRINPALVAKLPLTDSTIREVLRRKPSFLGSIIREVVPEDGLILPDGNWLSKGTLVGAPLPGIHMDEDNYPDPERFDPFRFTKTVSTSKSESTDHENKTISKNPMVQTSSNFIAFGYGRNAW